MERTTGIEGTILSLSDHARKRMQQRGITARMVRIALEYGERRWSHAAVCHRLTERSLCGTPFVGESDALRGLCVVVTREGAVLTVKWEYRLRRPGPLRRSNHSRWRDVQRARPAPIPETPYRLAA